MWTTLLLAAAAAPVETATVQHLGQAYHVVTVDLREAELRLVGQAPGEAHRFADLPDDVLAATNAALFHTPDDPVGLWVQRGREHSPLERGTGAGNFFLQPNGVLALDARGTSITATPDWTPGPGLQLAAQSGPLLLAAGEVHPHIGPSSSSLKLRNAAGVCGPWTVALVASAAPVRLHDLATLFRDTLGCDDALYLDGSLSGLRADGLPAPADVHDVAGFLVVTERTPPRGLRDGDLVFQRSRSAQAAAIAAATGSRFTHVGLVRIIDGQPWVLEAVQPVRRTPFEAWAARGIDQVVEVRRPRAEGLWTPEALARLDTLQAQWLGRPYDLAFAPGDDALYCSELVREAYLRATGLELAPLRPVGSYRVDEPEARRAMLARWGEVPLERPVVAPSDLMEAPVLQPVTSF